MKQNMNIEAEGLELILKNKAGDYVIIPKKYRTEVQGMIKDGCHSCIDKIVETLPMMSDYAEDGTYIPSNKTADSFFSIYKDENAFYDAHKDIQAHYPKHNLTQNKIGWQQGNLFYKDRMVGGVHSVVGTVFDSDGNCISEECTARANRVVDGMVGNSSYFEFSDTTKERLGLDYSVPRKPTAEEVAQYPHFQGDTRFGSADAWDYIPAISKKYADSVLYNSDESEGRFLTYEESKAYWDNIGLGAFINTGEEERRGEAQGRGTHLVRVVGFSETGEPLVSDYGQIKRLYQTMYVNNSPLNSRFISGIANVPEKEVYNFSRLNERRQLARAKGEDVFLKDSEQLPTIGGQDNIEYVKGDKRFDALNRTLGQEKPYLATVANIDSDKYDEYAKLAIAISGVETKYGTSKASVDWLDKLGETIGITQLNTKNVKDKYKKTLSKYKKNSPEYMTAATILYIKELDAYKDGWFKHGAKAQERPYILNKQNVVDKAKSIARQTFQGQDESGFIDTNSRRKFKYSREVSDGKFENVEISIPARIGLESQGKYTDKVNKKLQKEGYTDLRYGIDEKGREVIYKQTKGNTIEPTLKNMVLYGWQSPNTIYYGDAQGHSGYYKKGVKIYEELFGNEE